MSQLFASIIDNLQNVGAQTGFNVQQFIAQCIAFLTLCGFLWYFAWKPVVRILEERRKTKELADAEATRLIIIQKANEQANAIIAEAEQAAVARGEIRTKEATRQAEDIVTKAHEAAVLDRDRLLAELKAQVGTLVIQTTEKVAGKVLTAGDQDRLNQETIRQLSAPSN
jgi:F-type H+-transporting ATPase subunit b